MKALLYAVCGLAGGIAGGLAVSYLTGETVAPRAADGAARSAPARDRDAVIEALEARISVLERRGAAPPSPAAPGAEPGGRAAGRAPEGGEAPAGDAASPAPRNAGKVVAGLAGKPFGPAEAGSLFNWLARNPGKIADVIEALQEKIKQEPEDADLRVALATAYVAELANTKMPGPQQGMVWMKASSAYDAALKLEPNHWQARYGKAFGTSMAPEFIGLRPEAIAQFEELRQVQETMAPQPHFAQTYFRLGTLYKDAGNAEKARQIWSSGLRLFPANEVLEGALEASTKK